LPDDEDEDDGGARAFWSGTISFGLVSIPVNLFSVTRPRAVHLRMLGPDGAPLRRIYVCPKDEEPLGDDDLVRGYECEGGELVVVTDEELERLAPEKSRDIDLRRFVPRDELDPLYFERTYLLGPAGESTKAYRLLAATMERSKRAGIATFVMRGKEHLVAILADDGLLRAETLRFADEVRSPDDVELPEPPKRLDAACVRRFAKATEKLCAEEPPLEELEDDFAAKLRAMVEKKRKAGEGVVEVDEAVAGGDDEGAGQVDLMQLIQKSLAGKAGDATDGPAARPRRARTKREAAAKRTKKKAPRKKKAAARS
jgi:DNA end-binding protein Ku